MRPFNLLELPTFSITWNSPIMATIVYGIKNCDTVRSACAWLDDAGIAWQFHDFRVSGLSSTKLNNWLNVLGSEKLLNRRSTTWKQLSEKQRKEIDAGDGKLTILANLTLIKRPVVEHKGKIYNGFKPEQYQEIFK